MADLASASRKRTRELFAADFASPSALERLVKPPFASVDPPSAPVELAEQIGVATRIRNEYEHVRELPPALAAKMTAASDAAARRKKSKAVSKGGATSDPKLGKMIEGASEKADQAKSAQSMSLTLRASSATGAAPNAHGPTPMRDTPSTALVRKDIFAESKPRWHAPWRLMRVLSGHQGWVRALCVDPVENRWFASGSGDRTVKLWDLASGQLKLTLTGHIGVVRGICVSDRHPYLFSVGDDKMVKCWDLEVNKVVRHYHGHLSGVYACALSPTMDLLHTAGRDGVVRTWDMRTRANIIVLAGHKGTISALSAYETEPQVISSSLDSTIRLWDLVASKTRVTLTHNKKGVRALSQSPIERSFVSGSAGSIKQFLLPDGELMQNFESHNSIINTLSVNEDHVLASGSDDGYLAFSDYATGHMYQKLQDSAQPGSLDAESGFFASTFDKTGLRLITGGADKSIKVWKQVEDATEETHPLDWKPTLGRRKF